MRFRKAMNEQVEWVLEGIAKSKRNKEITHIYIADSHGGGQNLSYDGLNEKDSRVWLISGSPRPQYMMPAMDDSFDLAFFVGYHGGAGERASSMDHTYSGASVQNVYINGKLMNEATINAAYAGIVNHVPVGLGHRRFRPGEAAQGRRHDAMGRVCLHQAVAGAVCGGV